MGPYVHAKFRPLSEMVCRGHSAAVPLALANRDVLVEGWGALDGRRVGASRFVDVVGSAVGRESTLGRPELVGLGVVFYHVVFDQGISCPSVYLDYRLTSQ